MLTKIFQQLSKNDADIAGGKGASLGEMTSTGIPVPPGFVVLSDAFERFLEETDLNVEVDAILETVDNQKMHTVEQASEKIQVLILEAKMPEDIEKEILESYNKLFYKDKENLLARRSDNEGWVAVRSSATAEDGAEAAWAGQLNSYLNTTEDSLLRNVQKCWASLFTPRAIFYRFEKGLHNTHISVAVVVQKMVQSEKSGIAFSVHPVTEDFNQLIIEAGFGLGEAIVSGSITPDSYVVEKEPRKIIDINISTQVKGLFQKAGGGNEWRDIAEPQASLQVLDEKEILELSDLIMQIENHYGFPCDIEWAYENGKFYITQSRPITTLKNMKKQEKPKYDMSSEQGFSEKYERVFGGPDMPYLVSDIITDIYALKYQFITIYKDSIWTCYMPKEMKEKTLKEGTELYGNKKDYETFRDEYLKFIESYDSLFHQMFSEGKSITPENFEATIELFKKAESYYTKTQYFYTDSVSVDNKLDSDFGDLKEKGRTLLNSQYFSDDNYLGRVLGIVSKETNIDEKNLYDYSWREIKEMLAGKKDQKAGQKNAYITFPKKGNKQTLSNDEAIVMIDDFLSHHYQDIKKLKGSIANKGKVIGKAYVLDQGYNHENIVAFIEKMEKGDVLVTETTSPEIMMACQKASAIVTNQGGMMSHAAIVSRELRIPCIVGVEGATGIIKNNDLVEVDANDGVVRILKDYEKEKKNSQKNENADRWTTVRARHIPTIYPLLALFDWPYGEYFGLKNAGQVIQVWDKGNFYAVWEKRIHDIEMPEKVLAKLLTIDDLNGQRRKSMESGQKLVEFCREYALSKKSFDIKSHMDFLEKLTLHYSDLMKDNMCFWLFAPIAIERKIRKLLKDYPPKTVDEMIKVFSFPDEESYSQKIDKELEDLVEQARNADLSDGGLQAKIEEFSKKYIWFPYEYSGPGVWNKEAIVRVISDRLKNNDKDSGGKTAQVEEQKNELEDKLPDEAKKLFAIWRMMYVFQDDRKMFNSQASYYINHVAAQKISQQLSITFEQTRYLDKGMLGILDEDRSLFEKIMKERIEMLVIGRNNDEKISFVGESARNYLVEMGIETEIKPKDNNIITGKCVYGGIVRGKVRILKNSHIENFESGNIIVTSMTTPDFVPLIKKSSAIITDEGGIMCHAAIVARELRKPCIIGTKFATQVLKDGDLVEVDADNGVVRILERNI
ncbi:MAG: hypothetical protein ACD_15C00111G0016 [uncultured bacterium]|nr:MAG: hypothetical protein ACD_15C00111G0016 [uncultured bacterium]